MNKNWTRMFGRKDDAPDASDACLSFAIVSNADEAEDGPRIDAAFSQYFRLLLVQIFPQRLVHQLESGTLRGEAEERREERRGS